MSKRSRTAVVRSYAVWTHHEKHSKRGVGKDGRHETNRCHQPFETSNPKPVTPNVRRWRGSVVRRHRTVAGRASWAADEAPETPDLKFGMIALTDCSPIVIAHEKGFFKKYGINSTVAKGANWAAIRDSLSNGDIQATHMLIGMPIASTMGLLGSPKKPMVIPWLLNRNGQSITLDEQI